MHTGQTPAQHSLIPVNDCVLIKLDRVEVKEGKYQTRTNGIVVAIPAASFDGIKHMWEMFIGKRVYFEEYKEGARIKRDGQQFCFIKFEDIRGFEDVKIN